MKPNTKPKNRCEGVTRICSYDVHWWYDVSDGAAYITPNKVAYFEELPGSEEYRIGQLIAEECTEGELRYYDAKSKTTYYGWWKIER